MAFLGYGKVNGQDVPIFEFLADVPDFWINEGRKFALKVDNLPFAPVQNGGYPVETHSPAAFLLAPLLAFITKIILVIIVLIILSNIATTLFGPRNVQGVDTNGDGRPDIWTDPCGCVFNPSTDAQGHPILVPAMPGCKCESPAQGIEGILFWAGVLIGVGAASYLVITIASAQRSRGRSVSP